MTPLTLWPLVNVIIDQEGRTCQTEYRFTLVNSGPSFTIVAAAPGTAATFGWLALETVNPSRKGNSIPAMVPNPLTHSHLRCWPLRFSL